MDSFENHNKQNNGPHVGDPVLYIPGTSYRSSLVAYNTAETQFKTENKG